MDSLDTAQSVYNLENLGSLENYCYYRYCSLREQKKYEQIDADIKFSVVMPVYNTISSQLCLAIESVLNQNYDNFELILADDCSTWENVRKDIEKYRDNPHVKIIYREKNGGISECTNTGLSVASGDYIAFMDCDDILEQDALYEFAVMIKAHPEYDYFYSDQDMVTEDGLIYHNPFFKPEWSPNLFISEMYTNHLSVYRASIVKSIGGLISEYDGAQDYEFTLRFMEKSDDSRVGHVSKILYHWRERRESTAYSIESKEYVFEADRKVRKDMLLRRSIKGHLKYNAMIKRDLVEYDVFGEPFVSIIIYGDCTEKIEECMKCVHNNTEYNNYEILACIANKGDVEKISAELVSAIGEYILFLDADVRMYDRDWIEVLLGQAQQKGIGVVGAKILYKDSHRINHCGMSVIDGVPVRDFEGMYDANTFYFNFNSIERNCTAISLECLLISKNKYIKAGGLHKEFGSNADVALCLALLTSGYNNVVRNDVTLETGKAYENNSEKKMIFSDLTKYDHFVNCNLKSYAKDINIRTFPQIPEKREKIVNVSKGYGIIERIDYSDSIRISGYSRTNEVDGKLVNRYLIIQKRLDVTFRVRIANVPRIDILNKYNMDRSYLWDGFVTYVSREEFLENPCECSFYIEYEYENGVVRSIPIEYDEDTPKEYENRRIREFAANKKVYIYGAGNYGRQCFNHLKHLNIGVEAFVVSEKNNNEDSALGLGIKSLDDIINIDDKDKVGIFVALKPLFRRQVIPRLTEYGFENILMYPIDIF